MATGRIKDKKKTLVGEADLAATYVHKLFQAGLREHGMAIITPYSAQVEKLRSRLRERYPDLEIGTVVCLDLHTSERSARAHTRTQMFSLRVALHF